MGLDDRFDAMLEDLAGEPDYDPESEPSPADGDEQANRRLHRLRHLTRERAETAEVFDAEINRLVERRAELLARFDADIAWVSQSLVLYWEACRARDPKGPKTKHLPGGDLTARAQTPEFVYEDEAAFMRWAAETAPDLLRVAAPVPDKAQVKKWVTVPDGVPGDEVKAVSPDGEPVPGVVVRHRGEKVTPTPVDAL